MDHAKVRVTIQTASKGAVQSVITIELLVTAVVTVLAAGVLGYLAQKRMGAITLGVGTLVACLFVVATGWAGNELAQQVGAAAGLAVGAFTGGVAGAGLSSLLIRGKSFRVFLMMWLGYCAIVAFGYLSGGWLGLLTVSLPTVITFWAILYRVSFRILPLVDKIQHGQAFRALLTYTLNTNYPYYFLKDGKAEKRVEGNPFGQFFAGPGIILSGCDHAAYVTDGIKVKGVYPPGLHFTGLFDQEPKVLDLRSQLRAFTVPALTRDGIPIEVLVFIPFRIQATGRNVALGKSFPFSEGAVYRIVANELVERGRQRGSGGEKHTWDGSLARTLVTPIVQDVIGTYSVDELSDIPGRKPRDDIASAILDRARKVLKKHGLELVAGGISNLKPGDSKLVDRRIDNWRTRWAGRIMEMMSEGSAERMRQIEVARAEAEAEILLRLSRALEQGIAAGETSQTALALRFVNCLGSIVGEAGDKWPVPNSIKDVFSRLRGDLEEEAS